MAKKAKKTLKKAKRSSPGPKETTVRVDAVVRFVKRLDELQQLDEFLEIAKSSKAFVTLRGRSYHMVKSFVEQKQRGEEALQARRGVAAATGRVIDPCDGFKCF
jgi:hypothetical protein